MKLLGLLTVVVLLGIGCGKPESAEKVENAALTAVIQVPTVQCGDCVAKVETAAKSVEGVTNAVADKDKKEVKVTFASVLNVDAVRTAISNAGYDADSVKRSEEAYAKLDECCQAPSKL